MSLMTINEICAELRRSPATVMKLYYTEGLPMAKVGGIWESTKEDIDEWRRHRISLDDPENRLERRKKNAVKHKKW